MEINLYFYLGNQLLLHYYILQVLTGEKKKMITALWKQEIVCIHSEATASNSSCHSHHNEFLTAYTAFMQHLFLASPLTYQQAHNRVLVPCCIGT